MEESGATKEWNGSRDVLLRSSQLATWLVLACTIIVGILGHYTRAVEIAEARIMEMVVDRTATIWGSPRSHESLCLLYSI